jgi:hypothetical protein
MPLQRDVPSIDKSQTLGSHFNSVQEHVEQDQHRKKKKKKSKELTESPLKENGERMGIYEEVGRALNIYESSEEEDHDFAFLNSPNRPRSGKARRPKKSSLKRERKNWSGENGNVVTDRGSLDLVIRQQEAGSDSAGDVKVALKSEITKTDDISLPNQAAKNRFRQSLLDQNETIRGILNHIFDSETNRKRFQQRFSIEGLKQEELVADDFNVTGTNSFHSPNRPVGSLVDTFETYRSKSFIGLLRQAHQPEAEGYLKQVDTSPKQRQQMSDEIYSENQASGASTTEAGDNKRASSKAEEKPSANKTLRRLSLNAIVESFSSLHDERFGPPPSLPESTSFRSVAYTKQARRSSFLGFSLDSEASSMYNVSPRRQLALQESNVDNACSGQIVVDFPKLQRRLSTGSMPLSTFSVNVVPSTHFVERSVENVSGESVIPAQSTRADGIETFVPRNALEDVDEASKSSQNLVKTTDLNDDDFDDYIEDLVAKERRTQSSKSAQSDGEAYVGVEFPSNVEQAMDLEDVHFDNVASLDIEVHERIERLDSAPCKSHDLGPWLDRNTERKKVLSSVEDTASYGQFESIKGYSFAECLESNRKRERRRASYVAGRYTNDLISVDENREGEKVTSDQSDSDISSTGRSCHDHKLIASNQLRESAFDQKDDFELVSVPSQSVAVPVDEGRTEDQNESDVTGMLEERIDNSDCMDQSRVKAALSRLERIKQRTQKQKKGHICDGQSLCIQEETISTKTAEKEVTPESIISSPDKHSQSIGSFYGEIGPNLDLAEQQVESTQPRELEVLNDVPLRLILDDSHVGGLFRDFSGRSEESLKVDDGDECDPNNFHPREIETVNDSPLQLRLDENPDSSAFKDFTKSDGTSYFCYRVGDWKAACERRSHFVRFDKVMIREHKIVFGDNPSCSDSVPVMLDWNHAPVRLWQVDDFEKVKKMIPVPADAEGMARRLSWVERRELLKEIGGYTDRQIRTEEEKYCDMMGYETNETSKPGLFSRLFAFGPRK